VSTFKLRGPRPVIALVLCAGLAACSSGNMDDLRSYVSAQEAKPHGTIEPLPEIKPYQTFLYNSSDLRSPFEPAQLAQAALIGGPGNGISPNPTRPREALEAFPLDSLRMVGTLERDDRMAALVRTQDGTIHRVKVGNYMGQNHGKITDITEDKVELTEIVPDGQGGWLERQASVALSE